MVVVSSKFVKRAALAVGFDICGIARSRELERERGVLEQWLGGGLDGGLGYMHRNTDKRLSPAMLVKGARSVIVCGVSYMNDTSLGYGTGQPDVPRIASYARAADYHDIIRGMLRTMAAALEREYGAFSWRAFSDSAPVLEKRWAIEAGLGWQGRNSLIINHDIGSFFLIGELLVDAEVDIYDSPRYEDGCGECRLCVEKCPNGAIISHDGASNSDKDDNTLLSRCVDARRCIARLTIESCKYDSYHNGEKPSLGAWVFGCDECQSVCPYNFRAPLYRNRAFEPLFDPRIMNREFWLSLTQEEFRKKFGRTPLSRAGLDRIQLLVISERKNN